MWKLVTGQIKATESIQSPIGITQYFPKIWDWRSFWRLTALLSMVLAFMNLLPIPALDGGHILFIAVEGIIGRKPSDKFMERAQVVGMVLLLSLAVFAVAMICSKSSSSAEPGAAPNFPVFSGMHSKCVAMKQIYFLVFTAAIHSATAQTEGELIEARPVRVMIAPYHPNYYPSDADQELAEINEKKPTN